MTTEENTTMMNGFAEAEAFAAVQDAADQVFEAGDNLTEGEKAEVSYETVTETPQPTIQPVPTITVSEVLRLLSEGYARTESDKAYDASIGSIKAYFNLTYAQVKSIFTHPSLKGKRTKQVRTVVPLVNIIDDTAVESDVNNN